ncbi:chorismate lyase [Vibrio sp. TH_r3]|uniref:chorismate lyase n=1 Tax=Vibrio sp. TH_r3 TaxID=3082084 RepID=UPI002952F178|nr:chorismate lyase [Vibrio sp. TH_r3]MDV7106043.1 chorismate lyase [Vibrio sp. TH_r3]
MTELISPYIAALKKIDWQDINLFQDSSDISLSWLLEKGSLSRRLEEKCEDLTVNVSVNEMISSAQMCLEEKNLLGNSSCLLREVVLFGDAQAWLIGRTLIPENSLDEQPCDLQKQGNTPLGLTVFSVESVRRDALQFGWVTVANQQLVARRSRLWMNNKPMLVAELFLPGSPVYLKEVEVK